MTRREPDFITRQIREQGSNNPDRLRKRSRRQTYAALGCIALNLLLGGIYFSTRPDAALIPIFPYALEGIGSAAFGFLTLVFALLAVSNNDKANRM